MKESYVFVFFFVVAFITVISAENITLSYPADVTVGEEFDITLNILNFSEDSYDVKFEIMEGKKNIAQIFFDDTWKSSFYWLKEAFHAGETEKEFKAKIVDPVSGNTPFKVKIRNEKKTWIFDGYVIILEENEKEEEKPEEDAEKKKTVPVMGNKSIITENNSDNIQKMDEIEVISLGTGKVIEEPVGLVVYESKTEKIKRYSVFGFALLCLVLCILILWRRYERKN